jgi:hypothetical protein
MLRRAEIHWDDFKNEDEIEREIRLVSQTKKYSEPLFIANMVPLSLKERLKL